jgi:hypothetical protein
MEGTMNQPSPEIRKILLEEIEKWRKEGLVSPTFAAILSKRYEAESASVVVPDETPRGLPTKESVSLLPSGSESVSSIPLLPVSASPLPPVARPTLMQTLLSETSIKIALYLGAFFVIAAALILAALVAILRLPILLIVATLFGGAALALKKRLPQPSFILWLVFSALLPISAGVGADLLDLQGTFASIFWVVVLFLMTIVWGFSTWLYHSRFFSIVAFGALASGAWFFANIFQPQIDLYLFCLMASGIIGVIGVGLLKAWQGQKFALPLFIAIHLFALAVMFVSFSAMFYNQFNDYFHTWWVFSALTWLAAFAFYIFSDIIIAFPIFPFMAVGALIPIAWLALNEFEATDTAIALGWWIWAAVFAVIGEFVSLANFKKLKQYAFPLTLACLPMFFVGAIWGYNGNKELGFGLFAVTGLVLTLMHIRQNRWWVWGTALAAWLAAYALFFDLPSVRRLDLEPLYLLLAPILLLALADIVLPPSFRHAPSWRWPIRVYAALLLVASTLWTLSEGIDSPDKATIIFGVLACLSLLYALRFNKPFLAVSHIGYTTFFVVYLLQNLDLDWWLPALTILSIAFYAVGLALTRFKSTGGWSNLFRWSGLALGGILSLLAISFAGKGDGWYVGLIGLLFVIETYGRFAWMELFVHFLYILGFSLILFDAKIDSINPYLMGGSVLLLGMDMIFSRTLNNRKQWKWIPRGLGMAIALVGNLVLLSQWRIASSMDVAIGVTYAALFLVYALLYHEPGLAYLYFAVVPVTLLTAAGFLGLERWTGVLILLAVLYYALSWLEKPKGWGLIRRYSGLALGTLVALSAPFEGSGLWASLPVAVGATLWAVEAFRRKNVWLGFPANGLYLMAYFMILFELKVNQPQFFSLGAAVLGMLMHYLLMRAGSNKGAFITGMVSQLVLLSTTYIQMVANNSLGYFAALFFQSLVVLAYGLVIRSRSLVFTPIAFVVIGVFTVVFSLPILKGVATVLMVGCTGILFIVLGIVAVLMRERIAELRGRLSEWQA